MSRRLEKACQLVENANSADEIFGPTSGSRAEQLLTVKVRAQELAQAIHLAQDLKGRTKAQTKQAMMRLLALWKQAQQRLQQGTDGTVTANKPTIARVRTENRTFLVGKPLTIARDRAEGDVADFYLCHYHEDGEDHPVVLKLVREAADNDLIANEATRLEELWSDPKGGCFHRYLPQLIARCTVDNDYHESRHANVLNVAEGYCSLSEVAREHPDGVDAHHFVWIFNRLLEILGYVHQRGLVHGAVLPPHVLIHPKTHGLILLDWVHAVNHHKGEHVRVISESYEDWYPPEVLCKSPAQPNVDVFMAARCMIWILAGDPLTAELPGSVPPRIQGFLKSCLFLTPSFRPNDAWQLRDELDELGFALFGPRQFHHFEMPRR